MSGNDLPGIASQFANHNLGFTMQFCNCVAKYCVKHMVHAVASIQLLSSFVVVATHDMSSKLYPDMFCFFKFVSWSRTVHNHFLMIFNAVILCSPHCSYSDAVSEPLLGRTRNV